MNDSPDPIPWESRAGRAFVNWAMLVDFGAGLCLVETSRTVGLSSDFGAQCSFLACANQSAGLSGFFLSQTGQLMLSAVEEEDLLAPHVRSRWPGISLRWPS